MSPDSSNVRVLAEDHVDLATDAVDAATAIRRIEEAFPGDETVEGHRARLLEALASHGDAALDRATRPGHLTGSAFVVEEGGRRALLLLHAKLQRWLQPGGHADGEADLASVALREAREETGLPGLRVVVPAIDVDVHRVDPPREDAHDHLDLRFLVLAPRGAEAATNHESHDHRWVTEEELTALVDPADTGLLRLAARAFALARELSEPR